MNFEDEKDYVMRMIKEASRVLFSLLFGKQYTSVELEAENEFEVSGMRLDELFAMIDRGNINEAENIVLDGVHYDNKNELAAAAFFYQYLSEKKEAFLQENNYSLDEVLDGMEHIVQESGYGEMIDVLTKF